MQDVGKEQFAIKFIERKFIVENGLMDYVKSEMSIMHLIRHMHVVHRHQVLESTRGFYLVMEWAANGELFDKIIASNKSAMMHSIAGSTDYQPPEMVDPKNEGYDGYRADYGARG